MESSAVSKWLRRLIHVVGALVIMDGAVRATDLVQAHTCGLNQFELRDFFLALLACSLLVGGFGTVLLKWWGRALMLVYLLGHTAYTVINFFLVLQVPGAKPDTLGWILVSAVMIFCV